MVDEDAVAHVGPRTRSAARPGVEQRAPIAAGTETEDDDATADDDEAGDSIGERVKGVFVAAKHARRRSDFARATARLLEEMAPGTLFTVEGAALFCSIAASACDAVSGGFFRLSFAEGVAVRLDTPAQETSQIPDELLHVARHRDGIHCTPRLLIARIWPWEPGDVAKTSVFVVLKAPEAADEGEFSFTQVDRRRVTTLAALIALREGAYEQRQADLLLREGTRAMAATSQVERRLADLASTIAKAAGTEHVAIWMQSPGNTEVFRLNAVEGGLPLADARERAAGSPHVQKDLVRHAGGRPAVVATKALAWLTEIFGKSMDQVGDAVLIIPVRRAGELIGVATGVPSRAASAGLVDVGRESTTSLLEALADQIALATEFARTTRDAQHSAKRFALLAALAEIALVKMGAAEMIDAMLTRTREYFAAHKVSLFLLHGSRGALGSRSVQRQEAAAGNLYTTRVPVKWEDQLIGSLVLRRANDAFDELEEETLVQVSDQIALALSTSGRYEFQASMAVLDPLTDLPNRRSAEATLDGELTRARQGINSLLCVAIIDIDNFKAVNDTFGHEVGDHVLREVAAMFKAQVRGTDYVARWGGEEFLLVYHGPDLARIQEIGERVRNGISMVAAKSSDGQRIAVTASLGGAIFPLHGTTRDQLIVAADTALYGAKNAGRDQSRWSPVAGI